MCHVSCVGCVMCGLCDVSCATCHMSYITCHLSLMTTATATYLPPLLTAPLCTVGWFAKTKNTQKLSKTQNLSKLIYPILEISQPTRSLQSIGKQSSKSHSGLKQLCNQVSFVQYSIVLYNAVLQYSRDCCSTVFYNTVFQCSRDCCSTVYYNTVLQESRDCCSSTTCDPTISLEPGFIGLWGNQCIQIGKLLSTLQFSMLRFILY